MKITGPGQPPVAGAPGNSGENSTEGPLKGEGVGSASRTADATGADAKKTASSGKAFAEKVSGEKVSGTTAPRTAEVNAARRPGEVSVQDLAAELKAGKLDARAAVDKMIDRVVGVQLGAEAPAHVREKVQAALRDALESDPLLAEKLRGLA
jgi:hypothetical protein